MTRGWNRIKIILLSGLLTASLSTVADAGFYQYEDESGALHFTDNPASIPKKYKKTKKSRGDDGEDPRVTPVQIKKNRALLPVVLCYRGKEVKGTFVLDTGAEVSTMTPAFADLLGIDPDDAEVALARGIGEGVHTVGKVKLDHVLVGPNRKYGVEFVVIPAGGSADGLLGMNFLRGLRYHVNFDRSTIDWGE